MNIFLMDVCKHAVRSIVSCNGIWENVNKILPTNAPLWCRLYLLPKTQIFVRTILCCFSLKWCSLELNVESTDVSSRLRQNLQTISRCLFSALSRYCYTFMYMQEASINLKIIIFWMLLWLSQCSLTSSPDKSDKIQLRNNKKYNIAKIWRKNHPFSLNQYFHN